MPGWNNPQTAQKYDSYAKTFSTYRDTSRDLVRLAKIEAGMRVVDLACGTGMTSQAILKTLSGSGHIYAVDLSPAMLAVARQNITADDISFHQAPAEAIHEAIPGVVDRVVCNSAFWQMQADETLQSVRKILRPGAYLAFNLVDFFSSATTVLRTLMRQVAQEDFGISLTSPARRPPRYTVAEMRQRLAGNGFVLSRHERIEYQRPMVDAREFCAIPIMTESTLPGVDYKTRLKVLERAYSRLEATANDRPAWDYYLAEARSE